MSCCNCENKVYLIPYKYRQNYCGLQFCEPHCRCHECIKCHGCSGCSIVSPEILIPPPLIKKKKRLRKVPYRKIQRMNTKRDDMITPDGEIIMARHKSSTFTADQLVSYNQDLYQVKSLVYSRSRSYLSIVKTNHA